MIELPRDFLVAFPLPGRRIASCSSLFISVDELRVVIGGGRNRVVGLALVSIVDSPSYRLPPLFNKHAFSSSTIFAPPCIEGKGINNDRFWVQWEIDGKNKYKIVT